MSLITMLGDIFLVFEAGLVIAGVHVGKSIVKDIDPKYSGSMGVFGLNGGRLLREHERLFPGSKKRRLLLTLVGLFMLLPPLVGVLWAAAR